MVSLVRFEDHRAAGVGTYYVPDGLWRVAVPTCFARVVVPDLITGTTQGLWDLRDRNDRRHLYAMLLLFGAPVHMTRWVDGAMLVDLWDELEIPAPVRASWDPVVRRGAHGPTDRW